MYRWSMMKKHPQPKFGRNWFMGAEIWPHEYLISSTEISINWPGSKQLSTGQFTPISVGLIRYSCGHISGHHEPNHVKFGVWGFFIMFSWIWSRKYWNAKKKIWWCHTSVLYSWQQEYRLSFASSTKAYSYRTKFLYTTKFMTLMNIIIQNQGRWFPPPFWWQKTRFPSIISTILSDAPPPQVWISHWKPCLTFGYFRQGSSRLHIGLLKISQFTIQCTANRY